MPECNLCDRYFVDNNALRMHNESKHEIECNYCDRTFSTPDGRDQHERMKHNCCNICNREFGSRESLDQHTEAKHSEYECRYCDKGFASDGARLQHQNAKHAPPPSAFSYLFSQPYVQAAKPAPMEQPDVNAVLGALSAQEFTPERDGKDVLMTQSLNVQATAPQPVADLTCGTCGEPFATIFALEAHKSQHRPGSYACTICERADKPCNCVIRKGISSLTGLVNDKPLDRVHESLDDPTCLSEVAMNLTEECGITDPQLGFAPMECDTIPCDRNVLEQHSAFDAHTVVQDPTVSERMGPSQLDVSLDLTNSQSQDQNMSPPEASNEQPMVLDMVTSHEQVDNPPECDSYTPGLSYPTDFPSDGVVVSPPNCAVVSPPDGTLVILGSRSLNDTRTQSLPNTKDKAPKHPQGDDRNVFGTDDGNEMEIGTTVDSNITSLDHTLSPEQTRALSHPPQDLTNELQGRSRFPVASGGFGDIWKCELVKPDESVQVAVKTIRAFESDDEVQIQKKSKRVRRELKVWGRLKHDSILPLWGVATDFGPYPAMICPWADNGTLTGYLERQESLLSSNDKFSLLNDIAIGLQYLHSKSIVHGDLTGSNVLIYGNGRACLADFGLSTIIKEFIGTSYFTSTIQGNARWVAAELFEISENDELLLSTECDIYSFGSITLQVLTCKVPYYDVKDNFWVLGQIMRGIKPKPPNESQIMPRHWEFIQRCWLSRDIRPSVAEIVAFVASEQQAVSS